MPIVDVILLCVVLTFSVLGFAFGFIHTLGNLVGTIAGMFIGSRVTSGLTEQFGISGGGQVFIFILIFIAVSRGVGLLFWFGQEFWKWFDWIPFAKTASRLLGGLLGLIEGIMIAGVIVYYAIQILPEAALRVALEHSWLAGELLRSITILQLLFPEELRTAML